MKTLSKLLATLAVVVVLAGPVYLPPGIVPPPCPACHR